VRILFTFAGGRGHAEPLVPIARAAVATGHAVAFAGRSSVTANLAARGFTVFGDAGNIADPPPERKPLLEVSAEREDLVLRYGFADRIARVRANGILALCAEYQPDVIVCDEIDFGSVIAAERLALPHATVLVIAAGSFVRTEIVAEPLNALRREHGLPQDPALAMLSRSLVLSPFPVSFRDPAFPLPETAHSFRPGALDAEGAVPESRLFLSGDAPTIYFTLGTVFNIESGDLFARVLAGLGELRVNVVVTVGPHIDPEELGPQPPNIRVEQYIPQALVLPSCDLVVSHGGSGSVIGALAHGLPSVVIPMGADQLLNAARGEALGVARVLDAVRATPESVRAAVSAILDDPSYRSAAGCIKNEIDRLPGPESSVPLLERCATG
jgi:UDP:flavonoid glycosyltransferase YjiC (YdhE family)